jgi:F-type H+-transporting ATPase subunit delta
MPDDRLIRGYAQALFDVADAEGHLEAVEAELYRFARALDKEPRLQEALTDPQLPIDRKKAVLHELLDGRAQKHTVNLLGFLVEQGRARDLSRIAGALAALAAEGRHHALAEVRTAVALDARHRDRLARALSQATGRDVEMRVLVDPAVIGGVFARVGDLIFDGTIRRKLELARQQLAGTAT